MLYLGIKNKKLGPEENVRKIYGDLRNCLDLLLLWYQYTHVVYMPSAALQHVRDGIRSATIDEFAKKNEEGTLANERNTFRT